jgi:carboxypeptidase Taq
MDRTQALDALKEFQAKQQALSHAMGVLYLDGVTVAPSESSEGRGRTLGYLSEESYKLAAGEEVQQILQALSGEELPAAEARQVQLLKRGYDQLQRIPMEEYVEYTVLLNTAESVWEKAKRENDYNSFAPYLERIIETERRFAGYYDPTKAPYDALLNEYERGVDTKMLDEFFSELRETIVPLVRRVSEKPRPDDSFMHKFYPAAKQRELAERLMDVMGIDRSRCVLAESEHPFTENFNNRDVRITTHYYENDLASSMYSVIHEGGHALYEIGVSDEYQFTSVGTGASMGIHESQSRFYENIIGRSREFIDAVFPIVKEIFPEQLAGVTAEQFYRAVNIGEPSLVRTEADELTYCLHIYIRYELEKRLISGELSVSDLPAEWNRMYRECLGVEVPDDTHGVLQDSHWAGGSIGYFPSYALGNAYGAQLLDKMQGEIDVWGGVSKGDLSAVTAWLREHIHRHGSLYDPRELFESVCGELDASHYTRYLTEKFTRIYDL